MRAFGNEREGDDGDDSAAGVRESRDSRCGSRTGRHNVIDEDRGVWDLASNTESSTTRAFRGASSTLCSVVAQNQNVANWTARNLCDEFRKPVTATHHAGFRRRDGDNRHRFEGVE
jgi:hypothetical protein